MRLKTKTWGAGAIALITVGGLAFAATSANAAIAEEPPLTVTTAGTTFYTTLGVESVWSDLVASRAGELPEGVTFPSSPTDFFYPVLENPDDKSLFEQTLPDSILDRYERCAWIDVSLDAVVADKAVDESVVAEAVTVLEEDDAVKMTTLPDGTEGSYADAIDAAAATEGVSSEAFEFEIDCEMYLNGSDER